MKLVKSIMLRIPDVFYQTYGPGTSLTWFGFLMLMSGIMVCMGLAGLAGWSVIN